MGSMVWDHQDVRVELELPPADEREIVAAFERWWNAREGFGRTRDPFNATYEREPSLRRFIEGWRDSETNASDFKRRGMPHENGERGAYMTARFLSAADRMARRRLIRQGFGE